MKPANSCRRLAKGGFTYLRILFLTRSGYFNPGRRVTSMVAGVSGREWDALHTPRPPMQNTL